MNEKRRFKGKLAVCLTLVGILLMGYSVFEISQAPGILQYVVPADIETKAADTSTEPPPTQLQERIKSLSDIEQELQASVSVMTLTGTAPGVSLSTDKGGATAGLIAIGKSHFAVYPALLLTGRFPNEEELELGERVMLVDEQVALALFQMADIVDREVTLQEKTYRIIGVLRHQKQVGDEADRFIYVPLAAIAKRTDIQLETLRLSAVPVPNGGAQKVFEEATKRWKGGGTAYDLRKERIGATIWMRFLACGIGFAMLGWLISLYVQSIAYLQRRMKERLVESYITHLLPYLLSQIFLRILALAALAAMAAGLALLLLMPIKVYPEYVPVVLVEPKMIANTFWDLRRSKSAAIVLRTPQVIRLSYFAGLCNNAAILILAGICLIYRKLRHR